MPWPLPLGLCRNRRSLLARQNLVGAILFALRHPSAGDDLMVADPEPLRSPTSLPRSAPGAAARRACFRFRPR